jgi:hypothetical protein
VHEPCTTAQQKRTFLTQTAYHPVHRNILEESEPKFKKCAKCIILNHINRPIKNAENLKEDLRAIPFHLAGQHSKCSSLICDGGELLIPQNPDWTEDERKLNLQKLKIHPGFSVLLKTFIFNQLTILSERMSEHSISYLYNLTTNIAESFQSQVNKFAQGRRCNNILRGGYNRKAIEALFAFQFGPTWYVDLYENLHDGSPSFLWKHQQNQANLRRNRIARVPKKNKNYVRRKANAPKPKFFSRTRMLVEDPDYGDNAQHEDIDEEELSRRINEIILEKSILNAEQQLKIHEATIGQFDCDRYKVEKEHRLTASMAGTIFGLRNSTPNVGVLDSLFNPPDLSNKPAVAWGTTNESKAIQLYEATESIVVLKAELFVSLENGILAASPDGLVGNDGLLEVKCPYVERYTLPSEVVERRSFGLCRTEKDGVTTYTLRPSSKYYLQVIMQLHITGRCWCDFVVWTQGAMEKIPGTEEYTPVNEPGYFVKTRINRTKHTERKWNQLKVKLINFFMDDYGPEIVDPRFSRNLGYRQPEYRLHAMRMARESKISKAAKKGIKKNMPQEPNAMVTNKTDNTVSERQDRILMPPPPPK